MKKPLFIFFTIFSWIGCLAQPNVQSRVEDTTYCHWVKKRINAIREDSCQLNPGWRYDTIYSDEFEGTTINTNKWYIYDHYVHGNNKKMGYMNDPENIRIDNGRLLLNVTPNTDSVVCYTHSVPQISYKPYFLSGGVKTYQKMRYGYFETECYLPKNHHYWPCFWIQANDVSISEYGEVDVFERTKDDDTDDPKILRQNCYDDFEYDEWSTSTQIRYFPDSITGKATVFGVEILPMELVFYINGHVSSRLRYDPEITNYWNTFTCSDVEELLPMNMRLSLNCRPGISEIPQPHEPAWFSYARCYKLKRGDTDTFHPTNFVPSEESTKVYPHIILGGAGCTASVNTPTAVWAEQDIVFDKGFVLSAGTSFTARVVQVPDPDHSPLYIQNCHQPPQNKKQ